MARKWVVIQRTGQAFLKTCLKRCLQSLLVPRLWLGNLYGDSGSVSLSEPESQEGISSETLGTRKHETVEKGSRWYCRSIEVAVLFLMGFIIAMGLATVTPAVERQETELSPQQLIERSQTQARNGDLSGAIRRQQAAIDQLRQEPEQRVNVAISLTNLGRLNLQAGHLQSAHENFSEADRLYPVMDHYWIQNRGYQVQALRQLGQYQAACSQMVNTLWLDTALSSGVPGSLGRSLCDTGDIENTALEALDPVVAQQSETLRAALFRELGVTLRVLGHLDAAEQVLAQFPFQQTDGATQLSLANIKRAQGNLIRDRLSSPRYNVMPWRFERETFSVTVVGRGGEPSEDYQKMQRYYQQAQQFYINIERQYDSTPLYGEAQLNHLRLLLDQIALFSVDDAQYQSLVNDALKLAKGIELKRLPVGQSSIFAWTTVAKYQAFLNQLLNTEAIPWGYIQSLLDDAKDQAEALDNPYALSYVLGNKGGLYEYFAWLERQTDSIHLKTGTLDTTAKTNHELSVQWRDRATQLTQAALMYAQPMNAPDIVYQWQWQLGRLDQVIEDKESAIAHYNAAVDTLQVVRRDLLNIKADVRFSFRDDVEPVYRGLVDVLLSDPSTQNIEAAVNTIDGLQLAELESFLRCRLGSVINVHQQLDEIDPKAAFIYPIILRDRLEVIAKLPGQPLQHHFISISSKTVESELKLFYRSLLRKNASNVTKSGNNIYEWLLKPIEDQLENQLSIDTLVFVPDTSFRRIPPSALYDHENGQYVLEKNYATVLVPSTQLFNLNQLRRTPQILSIGISEEQKIKDKNKTRIFPAITNVVNEVEIFKSLSIPNQILLDSEATKEKISDELKENDPSIIHFATHGEFSSDPESTFIVLYQDLLKSYEFENLIKKRNTSNGFDLLTLGACKTAQGDNRAVLGLAGLAVRTQASSTLASLWKIKDEPAMLLMERFYQEVLNPKIKTTEALHRAQLFLRGQPSTQNPYTWSSFILVGNWL